MTFDRSRSCRSATDSSSNEHVLDTWLALMRSMPMACATRFTFPVDTPSRRKLVYLVHMRLLPFRES